MSDTIKAEVAEPFVPQAPKSWLTTPPQKKQRFLSFRDLDLVLFQRLVLVVVKQNKENPETLFALAEADPLLSRKLCHPSSVPIWQAVWFTKKQQLSRPTLKRIQQRLDIDTLQGVVHPRKLAYLMLSKRCMLCNASDCHVSWKLRVRYCNDCLMASLLKETEITKEFGGDHNKLLLFQHLPSRVVRVKPKKKEKTRAYLLLHVQQVLQQQFGLSSFKNYRAQQVLTTFGQMSVDN